eukprot:SAG11_NODE_201_length_12551_cov_67.866126_5_plen_99_part_00
MGTMLFHKKQWYADAVIKAEEHERLGVSSLKEMGRRACIHEVLVEKEQPSAVAPTAKGGQTEAQRSSCPIILAEDTVSESAQAVQAAAVTTASTTTTS